MVAALIGCGGASDGSGPTVPTEAQPTPTIVYTVADSTSVRVTLSDLSGTNRRTIPCPETYCVDGEISPDGKQLLVTGADASGVRRQYVMGTDGSNPRLIA